MAGITYITTTGIYTGHTASWYFRPDVTILKGQTLIIFISSHDVGLTPTPDPSNNWNFITSIRTGPFETVVSAGTLFSYWFQAISDTINPTWHITGLSPDFNTGYGVLFSNCTINPSKLINTSTYKYNLSGSLGTDGFTTTSNKTAIIQAVSLFSQVSDPFSVTNGSWVSTPSLTWSDSISGISGVKSYGTDLIIQGLAISLDCPKTSYTNFSYELSASHSNMSIDIALTSKIGQNTVLNLIKSF